MNFLAHCLVAERAGMGSADELLGAALSDLAAMAGVRFDVGALPEQIAAGVRCHWAADRAFHADRAFVEGAGSIRRALADAGVAVGPSRAVGHAGWELLLDGTPAVQDSASRGFERALGQASAVAVALDGADAARWAALGHRMDGGAWWSGYSEPAFVAERLLGMLGRRPRLAFDGHELPVVTEVLEAARPAVVAVAEAVLDRVVEKLRAQAGATAT
jgi:acyl carrier protein phosphodiesterase